MPRQLSGERADVCIVCREPMESGRVLPCGHIMHGRCLLSWLERSQTCPICRVSVLAELNEQPQQPPIPPQQQPQPHPHPHGPPNQQHIPFPEIYNGQPFIPPYPYPPVNNIPPVNNNGPTNQQLAVHSAPEPQINHDIPRTSDHPLPSGFTFALPNYPTDIQPSDLSRIEAHVELMQEQLAILQEQFGVLLSDIRNYKRTHGGDRNQNNTNLDSNLNTSPVNPETTTLSEQPPSYTNDSRLESPPPALVISPAPPTENPDSDKTTDDPERDEIRKRRLLRFSSEHTIARPDN